MFTEAKSRATVSRSSESVSDLCMGPTPWLVYSSLKTRGALPPWLSDWGGSCPPSPPGSYASVYTSVKIIKNEVGCRDDTVPKTVDTRRHCEEE